MKVLVCGSRTWKDGYLVRDRLDFLEPTEIIHGGARGPDVFADWWAADRGIPATAYYPDWGAHGRKAGILRNNQMLDKEPDLVLAFWDGQSKGTKHTIDEARRRGISVEVWRENGESEGTSDP